jgi:YidC/Oxa1 family membrane protein insertase
MDKKGILIIVVAVAAFLSWELYYGKQMQIAQKAQLAARKAAAAKAEEEARTNPPQALEADPARTGTTPASAPPVPPAPAEAPVEEVVEKLATKSAEYAFTNAGGGISKVQLFGHLVDKKSGAKVVLNEWGNIPIGLVSEAGGAQTNAPFKMTRDESAQAVIFERVDERQLALTKKFTLPQFEQMKDGERLREEFLLRLDLTFANRGTQPLTVPTYYVHTGSAGPLHALDTSLLIGLNYFRGTSNKFIAAGWFESGGFMGFTKKTVHPVYPDPPESMSDVRWASVTNQYFTTLIAPIVNEKALTAEQIAQRGVGVWAKRTKLAPEKWRELGHGDPGTAEHFAIDGALAMGGFTVPPGESVTRSFQILSGPREYQRLREMNNYETELLDFGFFGLISKGLLNSMNFLKGVLGSYWAAIILLTICIRSAMWPLQNRATQTAKKMQQLSPMLKELQEKYKEDPMRLQQETTKMWKEYGINPFGGCLPMLVQIPIFFGFYNMLNKAVELRNNGFLWVRDLSQPDTVAHLFGTGIPINPLPLVMAVTMLAQMQLSPKTGDVAQQRMMMFMPLIFIAMCYNYAAALALYWSVQNVFSIVQLLVTRDKGTPTLQRIAAPPKKKR